MGDISMLASARYSTSTRKWLLHMDGSESAANLVPVFPPCVIYHFRRPQAGGDRLREVAACPSRPSTSQGGGEAFGVKQ